MEMNERKKSQIAPIQRINNKRFSAKLPPARAAELKSLMEVIIQLNEYKYLYYDKGGAGDQVL
jgi:hypothetical protein